MKRLLPLVTLLLVLFTGCTQIDLENVQDEATNRLADEVNKAADQAVDDVKNEAKNFLGELTSELEKNTTESNDTFYKVSRVVDGDTIVISKEGKEEKIRLLMVDTPEVHGVETPEPYGPEASTFTKDLLKGQSVRLEYDQEKYDQYDRTLAYVYLEDGRMVNELLIEEGLASVVVYQPNDKYESEFREIEEQAKNENKGIWSVQ